MRDDIHPEELLVRVAGRVLGADEEEALRAHLARCPGCALQAGLRADVAAALVPTALDYDVGARAVERVLAGAGGRAPALPVRRVSRERAVWWARAAVVTLTLLGTSVGASVLVLGTRGRLWGTAKPSAAPPRARPDLEGARRGHAPSVSGPSGAPPRADETPLPTDAPATTVPAASPRALAFEAAPALHRRREPELGTVEPPAAASPGAPAESPPPPADEAPSAPAADADGAASLFAAAELARRQGRAFDASGLYDRLAVEFAGSREEITTRVLRGQMLLDDAGKPAEALASFERYLGAEPSGALAEDARAGRAQALWLLGRAREEAEAWTELLALYPRSVHATFARGRLAALAAHGD